MPTRKGLGLRHEALGPPWDGASGLESRDGAPGFDSRRGATCGGNRPKCAAEGVNKPPIDCSLWLSGIGVSGKRLLFSSRSRRWGRSSMR